MNYAKMLNETQIYVVKSLYIQVLTKGIKVTSIKSGSHYEIHGGYQIATVLSPRVENER